MEHWKEIAINLSESRYLNVPNLYQPHHVSVSILLIGEQQPLGRYDLADNITIGEGSIRTLLKRLTNGGYTTAELHHGQKLTSEGQIFFDAIRQDIPFGLFLELDDLTIYEHSFANVVKHKGSKVTDGVLQRDEALVCAGYGKAGATTLIMESGMLLMPPDKTNIMLGNEQESILLLDSLRPQDGDAVVIGSSIDKNLAREVAMAASMTLC